jgi:molybdate transport system substrate-binding protein
MRIGRPALLALALLGLGVRSGAAQALAVAAASDLQLVLPTVAAQFEKDTGRIVTLTFGSSGTFFAQLQNGAPFDVFLSADIDYPKRLEAAGLAEPGSLYQYARGHLVLWTRTDAGIDLRQGLRTLVDPSVRRVAIANPQLAPYGRAAVAALRHEGLYDRVQAKLIVGESISQAAQFVQSGSADVGLIARSVALADPLKKAGTLVEIPEDWYPPIEQAAIALASSRQKALAREFIDYLKKPDTRRTLQAYGFTVPDSSAR